jgi:hypothetical protein
MSNPDTYTFSGDTQIHAQIHLVGNARPTSLPPCLPLCRLGLWRLRDWLSHPRPQYRPQTWAPISPCRMKGLYVCTYVCIRQDWQTLTVCSYLPSSELINDNLVRRWCWVLSHISQPFDTRHKDSLQSALQLALLLESIGMPRGVRRVGRPGQTVSTSQSCNAMHMDIRGGALRTEGDWSNRKVGCEHQPLEGCLPKAA